MQYIEMIKEARDDEELASIIQDIYDDGVDEALEDMWHEEQANEGIPWNDLD